MRQRLWLRIAAVVPVLVGACTLVGGLTWVLLNLHGPEPVLDVTVGAVLAVGGLVLLMPHRTRLPVAATAIAAAATGLAGTVAGIAVSTSQAFGAYAYLTTRGWPYRWLSRGAIADDLTTAERVAGVQSWQVDVLALAANLLVWSYVGLLAAGAAVAVRRTMAARATAMAGGGRATTEDVGPLP
ncbi:hypothetical protein EV385_1990 [Krasilnikovia cinnamomea]|uniref:Uncharacterized protein n=1 Tax=Krasilnikovia cinnamomea TaxID=349313 RepID=A0A4Q7ZID8_9ACTN|nr:hypothetical protein [Krasilnikovia cinnamomea]RZU50224.1 hypothetical protein EV385_1990 [Krasilnikovia cinnamomea]